MRHCLLYCVSVYFVPQILCIVLSEALILPHTFSLLPRLFTRFPQLIQNNTM